MMDEALRLYHAEAIEVWENFCRLHHDLYELTCDEYQVLLSGEVESLEALIAKKEHVIAAIGVWEANRAELIARMNRDLPAAQQITNVSELLATLASAEAKLAMPALRNLNALLIDVITRVQEQNKRNQQFLNRAMQSIREIRDGFTGKRNYNTYGADGMTRSAPR